jgi:tetratricopeptide (TPR) repeat protein
MEAPMFVSRPSIRAIDLVTVAFLLSLGSCITAPLAWAHGGSSSGGNSSGGSHSNSGAQNPSESTDLTTCQKGYVWDTHKGKCLRQRSGVLPDDAMADYAFALAKAKRYQEALDVLDLLVTQDTPKALNYRGYATRKLGRTEEGISYYLRAVAKDPHYAQVREYLGEAYVIQGKRDLAEKQLQTIRSICGTTCEEYQELHEAIETGQNL